MRTAIKSVETSTAKTVINAARKIRPGTTTLFEAMTCLEMKPIESTTQQLLLRHAREVHREDELKARTVASGLEEEYEVAYKRYQFEKNRLFRKLKRQLLTSN